MGLAGQTSALIVYLAKLQSILHAVVQLCVCVCGGGGGGCTVYDLAAPRTLKRCIKLPFNFNAVVVMALLAA